jgi:hypothetical protein
LRLGADSAPLNCANLIDYGRQVAWRPAIAVVSAVCALATGCGSADTDVDLSRLDVGTFSTAARNISDTPSLPDGIVLEGIRMSDAVADTSQFGSSLNHLWQAGPIVDTASIVPVVGVTGKRVLDGLGWLAGYRATYADTPVPPDGGTPPSHIGLSITLLRFPSDPAAKEAASALELANWTDFGKTVAAPLPKHPEIAARYTPGTGSLMLDTPIGPFVLRLALEAPPDGIEKHIGELDAVIDEEQALLREFKPTPVAEMPSLARDPDGLLAHMAATDPTKSPPPSPTFAVYGPTGALRDQPPAVRQNRLYEKWGVNRLAVSGTQQLYLLRDSQAAEDMSAEFIAQSSGTEQEIERDPNVPNSQCFQADAAAASAPGYTCRLVFDNTYTTMRANTASSVKQMTAAQYALLASR